MPEAIREVVVVPTDLEIVAFVADADGSVLNSISCLPDCGTLTTAADVDVEKYKMDISKSYAFPYLELTVTNRHNEAMTSAQFSVDYNGAVHTVDWTGDVAPLSRADIKLDIPFVTENQEASNKLKVKLSSVNGIEATSDELSYKFAKLKEIPNQLIIEIRTEDHAAENTYNVYDCSDGSLVFPMGPYQNGSAVYRESLELEIGKTYCFEVTDGWGDGINSPRGYFKLYNSNDVILAQQMPVEGFGYRLFATVTAEAGVEDVAVSDNDGDYEVYDLSGVRILKGHGKIDMTSLSQGIYIARRGANVEKIVK